MTVDEAITRLKNMDSNDHIAIYWFEKFEIDEDLSDKTWVSITEDFFSHAGDDLCKDWLENEAYERAADEDEE